MTVAYATIVELESFLGEEAPEAAERLLERASEIVDDTVRLPYTVGDDGLPTNTAYAEALRDATCAQVEFWTLVGEDHDIEGLASRQVSIGALNLSALPPEIAPRAKRILSTAGLLTFWPTPRATAAGTINDFFIEGTQPSPGGDGW